MAKIISEYCNECCKETWHEYQSHNKWQLFTECSLCGAKFDLIPNGQVFVIEGTSEKFKIPEVEV